MVSTSIPVIDITGDDLARIAHGLVEAAVEHGFIYVKSSKQDMPADLVHTMFDLVSDPGQYLAYIGSRQSLTGLCLPIPGVVKEAIWLVSRGEAEMQNPARQPRLDWDEL